MMALSTPYVSPFSSLLLPRHSSHLPPLRPQPSLVFGLSSVQHKTGHMRKIEENGVKVRCGGKKKRNTGWQMDAEPPPHPASRHSSVCLRYCMPYRRNVIFPQAPVTKSFVGTAERMIWHSQTIVSTLPSSFQFRFSTQFSNLYSL